MDIRLMINVSKILQPLPYKVIMMICNDDDDDLQEHIQYEEVYVYHNFVYSELSAGGANRDVC